AIEDKILAENRNADSGADLPQVFEAALKILLVGQDTQAGRPMRLIVAGNGNRVEIGPDYAFARTGLFDFRNQLDRATGRQWRKEVANRWSVGQSCSQLVERSRCPGALDFGPLADDDLIEDRGQDLNVIHSFRRAFEPLDEISQRDASQ